MEKPDSNQLPLATPTILGQAPRPNQDEIQVHCPGVCPREFEVQLPEIKKIA